MREDGEYDDFGYDPDRDDRAWDAWKDTPEGVAARDRYVRDTNSRVETDEEMPRAA